MKKEFTSWHSGIFEGFDDLLAEDFTSFAIAHIDADLFDAARKGFRVHEGSISDIEEECNKKKKKVWVKFDKVGEMIRLEGTNRRTCAACNRPSISLLPM